MYAYEIIIENNKVKTNDFEQVLKIINDMIDKDYNIIFRNVKYNTIIQVSDKFDIAMIEDNIE